MRFTCRKCRKDGRAELSMDSVFAHGPWYEDRKGLLHNCIYCRSCGAVHDTIGSLLGLIKLAFGRVTSKVVFTYEPSSFQKIMKMANRDFPVNAASLNPLILEAMLEDERLVEEDLSGEPPAMDFLIQCTNDKDFIVRREAVAALARFSSKQAVDAAIRMLHDSHWDVRKYAARTLGELGDTVAIQPLNDLLECETWEHLVRKEATLALNKLQPKIPSQ